MAIFVFSPDQTINLQFGSNDSVISSSLHNVHDSIGSKTFAAALPALISSLAKNLDAYATALAGTELIIGSGGRWADTNQVIVMDGFECNVKDPRQVEILTSVFVKHYAEYHLSEILSDAIQSIASRIDSYRTKCKKVNMIMMSLQ